MPNLIINLGRTLSTKYGCFDKKCMCNMEMIRKCMMQKKGCICEKIAYLFPFQNGVPVKISLGVTQVRVHTAKW